MAELNGGLTAPAPERGLGSARRPRSVNRRQTPRGKKIERSVAENRQARANRNGNGPAIGGAVQPDLGAQLSRRVALGAIDQAQAEQVAQDRALLERVYGPDWRDRVFGGAGVVRGLRQEVASHGADEFGAKAKLGKILGRRKRLITQARKQASAE
jgi:hypothetical protein